PPSVQRWAGRPPLAAPRGRGPPRPVARPVARAPRLAVPARPAGPVALRHGPPPQQAGAGGERTVPALGGYRPPAAGRCGRPARGGVGGRPARPAVGRSGPDLPGPPRDLERQLGLPPVGPAALPGPRPEPEQLPVRRPRPRGGVA